MKKREKKGISLVILVVTILIMIILVGVVILSANQGINNANSIAFANDLRALEERITEYYVINKILPVVNENIALDKAGLVALHLDAKGNILEEEINSNGDNGSKFYELSLPKLNVANTARGTKKYADDVYYVAYPSLRVYYVRGLKEKDVYYFSVSNKINNISNVTGDTSEDSSQVQLIDAANLKVTNIKGYTSSLGVKIDVTMYAGEQLYLAVAGGTPKEITTVIGKNDFGFSSLADIKNGKASIVISNLTDAEIIQIEGTVTNGKYTAVGRVANRYLEIIKKKNGVEVGRVKIDVNGYSLVPPTIESDKIVSTTNENEVTLTLKKGDADIKEVKYEYLMKYSKEGTITPYFQGVTLLDKDYILSKGKRAILENNVATIKTDRTIQKVNVILVDKAGNSSMYEQTVATNAPPKSTWNNPYIPKGFIISPRTGEQTVADGLVIMDTNNGNEFVWIPVKDFSKFKRVDYNKGNSIEANGEPTWNGTSTVTELDRIYKSVKENGGFYIARYEAGLDSKTTPQTTDHNTASDGTIKPVSKKGVSPWNFIPWGTVRNRETPGNGAVTVARSMYNNTDAASHLIYGIQWDATLEYIKELDKTYLVDSTGKGNYTGSLKVTGSDIAYKIQNVYDMAGNDYEWTMEWGSTHTVMRGSDYDSNSSNSPVSVRRNDIGIGIGGQSISFRCALYIK